MTRALLASYGGLAGPEPWRLVVGLVVIGVLPLALLLDVVVWAVGFVLRALGHVGTGHPDAIRCQNCGTDVPLWGHFACTCGAANWQYAFEPTPCCGIGGVETGGPPPIRCACGAAILPPRAGWRR